MNLSSKETAQYYYSLTIKKNLRPRKIKINFAYKAMAEDIFDGESSDVVARRVSGFGFLEVAADFSAQWLSVESCPRRESSNPTDCAKL